LRDTAIPFASLCRYGLFAAGLLAVGGLRAAEPDTAAPSTADPPAGYLLIASDTIQDPRFYHSVILMVQHDAKGAFGIMINRPVTEESIAALLANSTGAAKDADEEKKIEGKLLIFFGGPVQTQLGFVVHSADYHRGETVDIDGTVAMTASRDILRDIGQHKGPEKYLFALGYAGWGAGQLENEIARHDWFSAPEEPELIFDTERATVWERALARRTQQL
jgi:putative transcriptional regulator